MCPMSLTKYGSDPLLLVIFLSVIAGAALYCYRAATLIVVEFYNGLALSFFTATRLTSSPHSLGKQFCTLFR